MGPGAAQTDPMSRYILALADPPALPVAGSDLLFPVRRIYCVGRNYAEHAREFGNDPDKEPPFFFSKPATAVALSGVTLPYPVGTDDVHHEAELVIAIGTGGAQIAPTEAQAHIFGYAAGNDLTRRDLQAQAKDMRRPWDMAKAFDDSAVLGAIHQLTETGPLTSARITADVDGTLRQDADIADMIWPVADIIAHLSRLVTLAPGDLIMTGTPAGVGPVERGQSCTVKIEGLSEARFSYGLG